jgi:hypothetical protein
MAVIEPNGPALALFGVAFAAWCWSFLTLAGLFPPSARPQSLAGAAGHVLVLLNVVLSIALLTGVALLAHQTLRWTSVVVFGGLIFLFVPSTFLPYRTNGATLAADLPRSVSFNSRL